jgi:hypothetical protein
MNTINGRLSPADGSATTMLFTHGCSKGSTFSAPDTMAVVNKGLNMRQKMHMGRGAEEWNKMAQRLQAGTVFCWKIHSPLR